jgi:hypothetical protein
VPEWAVGRTADEILEIAKKMYEVVVQAPHAPAPPAPAPAPAPSPAPALAPQAPVQPPNPDLMLTDPAEYQRQLTAYNQWLLDQRLQQVSVPVLASQAQMARNVVRSDPEYADVWASYGPEIDAEMARLPLEQRANPEMWRLATEMVAGRHRKELAAKLAAKAAIPADAGTVPADAGVPHIQPNAHLDPIDRLFAEVPAIRERYEKAGVSAQAVKDHARAMGHTLESYAELLRKQYVVTSH